VSSAPLQLGRGVVVGPGGEAPAAWQDCERIVVGETELAGPAEAIAMLHRAWSSRTPVVIELRTDAAALRQPQSTVLAPYELGATFGFDLEQLHFLIWANTYDARSGALIWWHGRKAVRTWSSLGVRESTRADIDLGDGTSVYVDGGPAFADPLPDGTPVVHRWSAEQGPLTPVRHLTCSADLAPDQLAAVTHRSGAARVIAPAGSGKTRVLTERLRHLVVDRGAPAGAVTALAFNTLAADELRSRFEASGAQPTPHIRTINSLGLAICNDFASRSGSHGAGRMRMASAGDVRDIIQSLFEIRRQANVDAVAPYIEALSAIRLGLVPPRDAEEAFPDAAGIGEGFDAYRRALAEAGLLDFDEQIYRAVEILLSDPEARREASKSCRWMLVDEFQDLHPAHLLLVRLLCGPSYDCFAVGDDDQVLYGYSGATPEYLIGYSRLFPGAAEHALETNYRCPEAVIDAVSHLLSYNDRRVAKSITASANASASASAPSSTSSSASARASGGLVVEHVANSDLASTTVSVIDRWMAEGAALDEMAVLARVASALLPVQVALTEAGTASTAPLGPDVLGRTGIRTALAYLRIGCDPGRIARQDILETVRRPSRGIAPKVVEMLTKGRSTSVADIQRLASRLSGRDVAKLESYVADLAAVARACGRSSVAGLEAIRATVGLGETMDALDSSKRQADRSSHADDLLALESVATLHSDAATFERWLRDTLSRTQPPGPAVTLSTVHRVKGREWSRVVVFGASEGSMPHRLSDDIEGERRVIHVALTRGRDEVVVLGDVDAPSSFLAELDGTASRRPPEGRAVKAQSTPGRSTATCPEGVRAAAVPRAAPRASTGDGAEEVLRSWRREVATRSGVPAYVVLTDADLVGICQARPTTLAQLGACRGMGPIRLERWGDEILAVIEAVATA